MLLSNLRRASVLIQDGSTVKMNFEFVRRRTDGKFVEQSGRFHLDWPKVLDTLFTTSVDINAYDEKRKRQYQDALKSLRLPAATERKTERTNSCEHIQIQERVAALEQRMDDSLQLINTKLDRILEFLFEQGRK